MNDPALEIPAAQAPAEEQTLTPEPALTAEMVQPAPALDPGNDDPAAGG